MSPAIEVDGLTRRFGDFVAVRDVSFHVERGEIFGYLGANGAGKSTTIRMLCGLLAPSGGTAIVAGHDIATDAGRVKASIGYMSQRFSLYLDLDVEHNLEFFGGVYGMTSRELSSRTDELLELLDLAELRTHVTGALPGGLRQRLALACALLHRPDIVFLDEPTAGVDPPSRREFWRLIRRLAENGTTVFVTTHYMDEAEYCGRIGLMVAGRLVALDTPAVLKREIVPGRMFSVTFDGEPPRLEELRATEDLRDAQPFGRRLHVRTNPTVDERRLAEALSELGTVASRVERVEPTLEDVFLEVVAEHEQQEAR